jgi:hypothetical protein
MRTSWLTRLSTAFLAISIIIPPVCSFQSPSVSSRTQEGRLTQDSAIRLQMSDSNKSNGKTEYSRELYLREEAESPFRKVRFFFYYSLGAGALTSLAVSASRVAAALAGINTDLLQESAINVGVDVAGLVVLGLAFQKDKEAQDSRLKRASKGAELARLTVRGSKSIITGDLPNVNEASETFTTSLASMRRGRGIEKRVVIAAAGKEKIAEILEDSIKLADSLVMSDLLIVPVEMPQGLSPNVEGKTVPDCVALPVGNGWKAMVNDEAEEAIKQGVNIEKEGICIILKKNGRVGQRTKGIFLGKMVGEVEERRDLGLDVKNI